MKAFSVYLIIRLIAKNFEYVKIQVLIIGGKSMSVKHKEVFGINESLAKEILDVALSTGGDLLKYL